MNSNELLDLIGEVRSIYIAEAQQCREQAHAPKPGRLSRYKVILIAAALAVLLAGCTYAVIKLQNLKIGQWVPNPVFMNETERDKPHPPRDVLSLHGYAGSPGYQAVLEWLEFENTYDPDGSLVAEADRNRYTAPEAYDAFFCFNQEMQDKVDEISQKHGLKLPGRRIITYDAEDELFPALGISGIHRNDAGISAYFDGAGYYYPNGSFHTIGNLTLTDPALDFPFNLFYAYRYTRKDSFDGAYLTVEDIEAFDQWNYTASDGTPLLLAISPEFCLVLADRGDVFLSISVYYPGIGEIVFGDKPMTHEVLEAFADSFDYHIQTLGIGRTFPSYADFLTGLCPAPTENDVYLLRDLDGDGSDELLVNRGGYTSLVLSMVDGHAEIVYFAPFCTLSPEENVIVDITAQDGQEVYRMLKFREGRFHCVDYVEYSALKESYGKSISLGDKPYFEVPISSDEAWDIINHYDIKQPRWYPVTEFPGFNGTPVIPTTPAAVPNAPTPEELGRPPETDLEFYLSGEPVSTAAQLFIGRGYSIYIPQTDWNLEQGENCEIWKSVYNPDVELKVAFYPGQRPAEVRAELKAQESGFDLTEDKQGGLIGLSKDWTVNLNICIYKTDNGVFALSYRYPMAAAEGFGTRVSVIADTFLVW